MQVIKIPTGLKKLANGAYQILGCRKLIGCTPLGSRPVKLAHLDASPEAILKDVTYALDVGVNMLNWLGNEVSLCNKTVLEIGPGINFGPILFLACQGAAPIFADRFLAPWDPNYHPNFYRVFRAELIQKHPEVDPRPIDRLLEAHSYPDDVLRRITSGAELLDLPNDSVDIVLSNAVFEHLEDHSKAFSELFRITKPGGWGFHQVDFRDHRSFDRPLGHLLMSHKDFERVANACFRECGTTVRHFEMIHLFQDRGFELKKFASNLCAAPEYLDDLMPRLRRSRRSPYREAS